MYAISERYEEHRKKLRPLENTFRKFQKRQIDSHQVEKVCKKYATFFCGKSIDVVVLQDYEPLIFVNANVSSSFKIVIKGIYLSVGFLNNFSSEVITAAFLHQCFMCKLAVDNPFIASSYWLSHIPAYIITISGPVVSEIINYLQEKFDQVKVSPKAIRIYTYLLVFFSILVKVIFFKITYSREVVSDSFATRFGYGPELVEFFNKYKEDEDLYGTSMYINVAVRKAMHLLRSCIITIFRLPDSSKRACAVAMQIIEEAEKDKFLDKKQVQWAREILKKCKNVDSAKRDKKVQRITQIVNSIEKEFKNARNI